MPTTKRLPIQVAIFFTAALLLHLRLASAVTWSRGDLALLTPIANADAALRLEVLQPSPSTPQQVDHYFGEGADALGGVGRAVTFDVTGQMYVTLRDRIVRYSSGSTSGNIFALLGDHDYPNEIVLDALGNAYVGVGRLRSVQKFSSSGGLVDTFRVTSGSGPVDIDLAADQCTLYYTTLHSGTISRFDVCHHISLPAFATLPIPPLPFGRFRLLPDGGMLITAGVILHLAASGQIQQQFTVPGSTYWQSLAVDPGGTSFVASGDLGTFRFNLNDPNQHEFVIARNASSLAIFGEPRNASTAPTVPSLSLWAKLLTMLILAAVALKLHARL